MPNLSRLFSCFIFSQDASHVRRLPWERLTPAQMSDRWNIDPGVEKQLFIHRWKIDLDAKRQLFISEILTLCQLTIIIDSYSLFIDEISNIDPYTKNQNRLNKYVKIDPGAEKQVFTGEILTLMQKIKYSQVKYWPWCWKASIHVILTLYNLILSKSVILLKKFGSCVQH